MNGMRVGRSVAVLMAVVLACTSGAWATTFNSGSAGTNGALPAAALPDGTTSMTLDLATGVVTLLPGGTTTTLPATPAGGFADGVLHFTTVTIPAGITLSFRPNAANTPVTILAQGDVNILGTIDVSGSNGAVTGSVLGGTAAPGGFKGGNGQISRGVGYGGQGLGPGGGGGGGRVLQLASYCPAIPMGGGAGGGFGAAGSRDWTGRAPASPAYGTLALLPLIGGSGGGGGTASRAGTAGGGGGGGGGAILIASSGTITVSGSILANGGGGGSQAGGGGSGGAVRLVATTIAGGGAIRTNGGAGGTGLGGTCADVHGGGSGGTGRVRLETYTLTFPGVNASPGVLSVGGPRQVFLPNAPSVRVVSVNGVGVSATPIGAFGGVDIELPGPGTFPVVIAASKVPLGTTISVTAKPETGADVIGPLTSPGLSGTADGSTATVNITFPASGVYFIEARATFALP